MVVEEVNSLKYEDAAAIRDKLTPQFGVTLLESDSGSCTLQVSGGPEQFLPLITPGYTAAEVEMALAAGKTDYGVTDDPGVKDVPEEHQRFYAQGLHDAFASVMNYLKK